MWECVCILKLIYEQRGRIGRRCFRQTATSNTKEIWYLIKKISIKMRKQTIWTLRKENEEIYEHQGYDDVAILNWGKGTAQMQQQLLSIAMTDFLDNNPIDLHNICACRDQPASKDTILLARDDWRCGAEQHPLVFGAIERISNTLHFVVKNLFPLGPTPKHQPLLQLL